MSRHVSKGSPVAVGGEVEVVELRGIISAKRGKLSDDSSHVWAENPALYSTTPTSETRTLAIDIGRTGALAMFDAAGQLLDIADMPVLDDGPASRPTVNGPLLAPIVKRWAPTRAVVEHVAARPGEAAPGSFAFGLIGIASKSAITIAERGRRPLHESFATTALSELAEAASALIIKPGQEAEQK